MVGALNAPSWLVIGWDGSHDVGIGRSQCHSGEELQLTRSSFSPECQNASVSKTTTVGLDQCGTECFKRLRFMLNAWLCARYKFPYFYYYLLLLLTIWRWMG